MRIRLHILIVVLLSPLGVVPDPCPAQEQKAADAVMQELPSIAEYYPVPTLKVSSTPLKHAKFPAIDIHTHFGFRIRGDQDALNKYVEIMDRQQIALCVSLDAKLGSESEHLEFLQKESADRFIVFAHIDFQGKGETDDAKTWACNQPGFVRQVCEQLAEAKSHGIMGVKFFKQFGLGFKNSDGSLITIDDPRWDPIWQTCGELQLPVLIHTGDPAAFFLPINAENERLEELSRHPDWSFHGPPFPSRGELLDARNRVIASHPKTQFIGAHVAGDSEDLATVSKWLDQYPNLVVDISSRIAELGRQPYTTRRFILKYPDRVLFGTDGPWPELRLTYYWRFLETCDEYFPYSEKLPQPQGLWFIYGLGLPDEVLEKIYFRNALRILPAAKPLYEAAAKKLNGTER